MFNHTKKWISKNEFYYDEIHGIKYPTVSTIIDIHDFLVDAFRSEGEKVHNGILSDAVLSFSGIKYYMKGKDDKNEDIIIRAAHIFNLFLEEGHPFVDGNKRTGFVVTWLFLLLNGIELHLSSFHYKKHVEKINTWADLSPKDNISEITQWIKHNIR